MHPGTKKGMGWPVAGRIHDNTARHNLSARLGLLPVVLASSVKSVLLVQPHRAIFNRGSYLPAIYSFPTFNYSCSLPWHYLVRPTILDMFYWKCAIRYFELHWPWRHVKFPMQGLLCFLVDDLIGYPVWCKSTTPGLNETLSSNEERPIWMLCQKWCIFKHPAEPCYVAKPWP